MTNLQSSTGGCFLINGAMVALDLATFNFNDDKISVSVGNPPSRESITFVLF